MTLHSIRSWGHASIRPIDSKRFPAEMFVWISDRNRMRDSRNLTVKELD